MDDCDWLLSVEKACDLLRIEPSVMGDFSLKTLIIKTGKYQTKNPTSNPWLIHCAGAAGYLLGGSWKTGIVLSRCQLAASGNDRYWQGDLSMKLATSWPAILPWKFLTS